MEDALSRLWLRVSVGRYREWRSMSLMYSDGASLWNCGVGGDDEGSLPGRRIVSSSDGQLSDCFVFCLFCGPSICCCSLVLAVVLELVESSSSSSLTEKVTLSLFFARAGVSVVALPSAKLPLQFVRMASAGTVFMIVEFEKERLRQLFLLVSIVLAAYLWR